MYLAVFIVLSVLQGKRLFPLYTAAVSECDSPYATLGLGRVSRDALRAGTDWAARTCGPGGPPYGPGVQDQLGPVGRSRDITGIVIKGLIGWALLTRYAIGDDI